MDLFNDLVFYNKAAFMAGFIPLAGIIKEFLIALNQGAGMLSAASYSHVRQTRVPNSC